VLLTRPPAHSMLFNWLVAHKLSALAWAVCGGTPTVTHATASTRARGRLLADETAAVHDPLEAESRGGVHCKLFVNPAASELPSCRCLQHDAPPGL